ncbi:hypothetical protein [Vibrio sp. R78045]|uniref:hypothetical protein n=1 Tax=Vibrio sp. R78045 TaxID=3093868 RepID=UPI0036F42037
MSDPINTPLQLVGIQEEFTNCLAVTCDNTLRLSKPVTNAARKLVQHSTKDYSIVVPDTIECVQAGDGSGDWVPALVFVPNEAVTETYCEVLKENGNKGLHIQVERSLFQRLMDIDVCRSNFSPDHFNISVNELVAEIIQAHFVHYDANEILSFDYVEVIRV